MPTRATLIGRSNGLVSYSRVQAETVFLKGRKQWARELFQDSGQPWEPGREVKGTYEGLSYTITIGPRLGVNVSGPMPDHITPQGIPFWLDGQGNRQLYPKPQSQNKAPDTAVAAAS